MIEKGLHSKNHSGFTLTELAIVLMGGVVVLGMGIPVATRVMDSYRLVMFAQTITTEIQYARMKSVASNESFRANFPAGQNYFQIGTAAGTVVAGPFYLPPGVSWGNVSFPGRYVTFLPTGNIIASGNGSGGAVTIANTKATKVDISVNSGGIIRQSSPYQ